MEAAGRRLALFSSHLHPIIPGDDTSSSNLLLIRVPTTSNTAPPAAASGEDRARVLEGKNIRPDEEGCVFCRIVRGESPAYKIYEDDMFLCILDRSPLSRGHSLLIPRAHFCSLDVTPPDVIAAMTSKIPRISRAIMKATGCDSFNLLVNNGAAAGQVVFHTHIHIIPRRARDCLWASESLLRLSLKLDQEASQLARSIREHLLSRGSAEAETQGS